MRIAVIADVHANVAALDAVLDRIARERVEATICLGDLVGYNAEPGPCIDRLRAVCTTIVAGNHDRDCLHAPQPGTTKAARQVIDWTREQLDDDHRGYIAGLPALVRTAHYVAAHGSYLSEVYVSGYVTSTMLEKNLAAIAGRDGWPVLAMCGHTHVPMFGWWDGIAVHESKLAAPDTWPRNARAVIVNPGSVGQPRDGDPRASYAVIDLEARALHVARVAYDIERTCEANARAGIPDELSARLREGR
jgi:predicted phosphodiesterase